MAEPLKANEPHFIVEVEGVGAPLRVIQFKGEEGLSQLFHFEVQIESDQMDIMPEDVVGQKASLTISTQGNFRKISGLISRFEFTGIERDVGVYVADLSPELYRLGQIRQSRMFQEMTVTDILKDVLETAGLPSDTFRMSCNVSYEPWEYCVQYRESDLDFFNRIAEKAGIFYFFEHTEDGSVLVIGDSSGVHPPITGDDSVRFHAPGGPVDYADFMYDFRMTHALRSTKHTIRDYNFKSPQLDLTSEATGELSNDLEDYDYPGEFVSQDSGALFAQVRMERQECSRFNGSGQTNSVRFAPGSTFNLINHVVDGYNETYLITGASHTGAQPTPDNVDYGGIGYGCEFRFQPARLSFRPPARTRKPIVEGSQTATVSGPDGDEIFSDEFCRIKVRFHWDRSDSPNHQSSCWIRVAQTWAGKGWGAAVIPRIGQEVVVDFLEGDPDRPIITGSVYNGLNMPPYALPDKQTVATFKSDSSLGGGGYNEIRFEDEKGSEEIFQHAQKDLKIITENDKNQTTGNNETLRIKSNRTKTVDKNEQTSIGGNRSESVKGNESISIDGSRSVTIKKNETFSVDQSRTLTVSKNQSLDVGNNATVNIGKNSSVSVGDNEEIQIGKDLKVSIGKKYGCSAGDSILISSDKEITLKSGSASIVLKKNGDITIKGKNINVKGSGKVVLKGSKVTHN